ncbi:MAG: transcription termination factor Rho [Gemmatimonadaceae bacterium]
MDPDKTNPQPPSGGDEPRAEPAVQERSGERPGSPSPSDTAERNNPPSQEQQDRPPRGRHSGNNQRNQQGSGNDNETRRNGRRGPNPRHGRRGRGGPRRDRQPQQNQNQNQQQSQQDQQPSAPVVADGEITGWFDPQRDNGFIRRAANSYLPDPTDPYVPGHLVRQLGLRRGDEINATTGRDHRNRQAVVEVRTINDTDPADAARRPEFGSLTASYPDRKLKLETGKPAKGGPEVTRRAIDLVAPIGYGQRALIVAPARAGKTMLLQAITEGVAVNHPQAVLLVLLVDERPEEVSEMITWGYGEVVASSFDMPANRHTDVAEITLERARRLVELGRDVVIVLDSITRLARAHNTVERGTGRTLSGGLDATAMAKPKAFFGSARAVAEQHGGGSLTIIATALVETGSRMDDVIFEEFKGTGNCEIKLDRTLAEKRIFPAIDIGTSGTRREEKLFRAEQLDHVYTLRRGLQQMPSTSAMEWLIKRIASTPGNDALLEGL